MDNLRPYEIDNLVVGAVRVLYAPTSVAVPDDIDDIIAMVSPYAPKTGWVDFGAAKSSASYSRGFEKEGQEIQQETGTILDELTATDRSFSFSVAEISPENLTIIENAAEVETIAAAANKGAQKSIGMDIVTELTEYRIAFVGVRKKSSGLVTEPGGRTRGRLVCVVGNRCTLAAEDTEIEFDKGNLAEAPVSFTMYPEPGLTEETYGRWLLEDAGTIAAT